MSDKLEADNERSIVCTSNKSMLEEKKGKECERVVFMKEVLQSQAARLDRAFIVLWLWSH
jgi:hypothetical protein